MPHDLPQSGYLTGHSLPDVVSDEYCTVVIRLQGRHLSPSEFLLELSLHVERVGAVEIVRFQVGDALGHPHT